MFIKRKRQKKKTTSKQTKLKSCQICKKCPVVKNFITKLLSYFVKFWRKKDFFTEGRATVCYSNQRVADCKGFFFVHPP